MRYRKNIAFGVLITITVAGLYLYILAPPREPVYKGAKLSSWLTGYDWLIDANARSNAVTPSDANDAVRAVGTAAIPTLLRLLQQRESPLMLKWLALAQKQSFIKIRHVPAERLNAEAAWGFLALGEKASNAVPALIRIYERNISPSSRSRAAASLGYIGPTAGEAGPVLLRGLTNADGAVRRDAIIALGQIRSEPARVIPALTKALRDDYIPAANGRNAGQPNFVYAAQSLAAFGGRAESAIPALMDMIAAHKGVTDIFIAREALRKIDPDADARLRAKARAGTK